jgi:hypothetical protein
MSAGLNQPEPTGPIYDLTAGRALTPEEAQAKAREALRRRVENDFAYHPPKGDQVERYGMIRAAGQGAALTFVEHCPPSRELSLALTHLETAVMMASASIARNE